LYERHKDQDGQRALEPCTPEQCQWAKCLIDGRNHPVDESNQSSTRNWEKKSIASFVGSDSCLRY
jgi:hypothetical protein